MKKCKLRELIKIKHGYAFKSKNYVSKGKFALVTLANISESNNFKYKDEKTIFYGSDFPSEYILETNDLIMPLTEQAVGLIGNSALIPKIDDITFVLNQRVGKVICTEKKVNKYFLHYLLSTKSVKDQLEYRASGTKQRNISPENIYDVTVYIPEIEVQEKIGKTLYNLEKKINHNNKIILELQKIIKMIYEYWFIQFEFPTEKGKPYQSSGGKMLWHDELKKKIPKDWQCKKIVEIESNIITGKTPSTKEETNFNGDIPFITIDDIRQGFYISKTVRTLSKKGANSQIKKYIPKDSICVTCIATVGLVGITTKASQTNQQINSILCQNKNNLYYLVSAIHHYFKASNGAKSGNIFDNMNKADFTSIKLLYPSENVLAKYKKKIEPIYHKIKNYMIENEELTNMKNYLLPLLMNGQVRFKI